MAPVSTATDLVSPASKPSAPSIDAKKEVLANPFYSPAIADDGDDTYKFAQYKVRGLPTHHIDIY